MNVDNFQVTTYVAEFWNTVTNLWMIVPPIHGMYYVYKNKFEKRCVLTFLDIQLSSKHSTDGPLSENTNID